MATRWIDFRALKEQVSIKDVLERYGVLDSLRETKPGTFVGPCPVHGGTNSNSFNVDVPRGMWNCFSDCKSTGKSGGNVLDLVMRLDNCSIREAGEKLCDWFELSFTRSSNGNDRQGNSAKVSGKNRAVAAATHTARSDDAGELVNPPLERPLKTLNQNHPYLVERGLTIPTIKHFGVGHCTRGLMRSRVAIPIHNERGELVAYAGRAVTDELAREKGKYRLPTNFVKSAVVYNLHRAREHADTGLIVVEGFFDCMKVHQAGFPNVVALMGSTLSDLQELLLLTHTDRLVVLFDGDDAGTACERTCYQRIRPESCGK